MLQAQTKKSSTTTIKSSTENVKFVIFALGIFICYFYYGILQEKITRTPYGENKEKFSYFFSLVFFQCIINAIYAKIMLTYILKQGTDSTSTNYYAACSFTYLFAMVASNMSLTWVNYPTQVVGKSCKPIPVMILGVIFGGKSYTWRKYFFVVMIVLGVALFMFKDNVTSSGKTDSDLGWGELLLLISLTMDGLTGAVQERMISEHKTKSGHMMLNMNLWSIGYLVIAVIASGEAFSFFAFVSRYPEVLTNMLIFSLCSAIGQFFIFLMVSDFGPLPCSIVTTTRKFFTVLGSVVFFGNVLSNRQWLGASFVFSGLTLDGLYGKSKKTAPKVKKSSEGETQKI